jgi:hypothetical protein
VFKNRALSLALGVAVLTAVSHVASAAVSDSDIAAMKAQLDALAKQNAALQQKVNDLSQKEEGAWLDAQRTEEIKNIVKDVLADAKTHDHDVDGGVKVGYDGGFYIQDPTPNFKLVVGGLLQFRYDYTRNHVNNNAFTTKPLAQGNTENSSGFDIRRARINFSGYAFDPKLFYRFEGDFYGGTGGAFTVTDAYAGYAFNDLFKFRVGSFKVPFSKVELVYDALLEIERPEENFPFDPVRALGASVFGDFIKNKLNYEVNVNDGSKSNTLRYVDAASNVTTITSTNTPAYNLDNRPAFYGRLQYSPDSIAPFFDGGEADQRKDNDKFIWLLGGAVGYESQNSSGATFAQNTLNVVGIGSNNSPGFKSYVLNGDIYRATADFSAKWRGLSINSAVYFQQINAEQYAGTTTGGLPYGVGKTSFNQTGYYAQVGYMVIPRTLELIARGGVTLDEGDPNIAEFYALGAVYYFHGNGAKIYADVDYSPEADYTDGATLQIANTQELTLRVQLQLKF